jgi:hypothetical protein
MTYGYFWNDEEPEHKIASRFLEKRIENGVTYYVDYQSTYWDNFKESKKVEKEFLNKPL